jgi:hypothetical protein
MNAINTINPLKPDTLINNPQGEPVVSAVRIAADARKVWEVVGNFGGFTTFIPALESIEVIGEGPGAVRHKKFADGNVVIEQLNARNEQAMSMTWTTIHNSLGVGNLWAAMTVVPGEKECVATWTIIAEPAEGNPISAADFRAFLQAFADDAMNNVRNLFI